MFPARLATLFSGLAEIDNRNVAVGGTTSRNWLPGSSLFENTLAPELPDADLIVITLGGNDIMEFISTRANDIGALLADIPGAIESAKEVVRQVIENLRETVDAIRMVNPNVDIAYCLYPNYTQAEQSFWGTVSSFLGPEAVASVLEEARLNFPGDDPRMLLVDMFGSAEGLPLSDYLFERNGQLDPLHFNGRGQIIYAEQVFKTLGGVLIGPNPLGENGVSPIGLERNYGLAP
jgi:lysophospholipase L1-like esterase